jgi:exonuclease-1
MGIHGLLPVLKPVTISGHVNDFKGQTLAVDTYSWLHRSVYGSCIEMFRGAQYDPVTNTIQGGLDIGVLSIQWVGYVLQYIDLLLRHEIKVVLVFDGDALPAKRKTEDERERSRAEALELGQKHLREGNEQLARQVCSTYTYTYILLINFICN